MFNNLYYLFHFYKCLYQNGNVLNLYINLLGFKVKNVHMYLYFGINSSKDISQFYVFVSRSNDHRTNHRTASRYASFHLKSHGELNQNV